MKILKQMLFALVFVIGFSVAASAQGRGDQKRPPKGEAPRIEVPDKKPPKDRPKNDGRGRDNRGKKPGTAEVLLGTVITIDLV